MAQPQGVEDRHYRQAADDHESRGASAISTTCRLGTWICMPSATKNNVTKKSRRLTALAMTSRL